MRASRIACIVAGCACVAVLAGCRSAAPSPEAWTPPAGMAGNLQLPRLAQPLVTDGELTEWSDAPRVAMRSPACITVRNPGHIWRGPTDAGMEARCAWNQDGLCFAITVTDDDVRNEREGSRVREHDCAEIIVDPQALANRSDAVMFHKFYIRPPTPGREAQILGIDPAGFRFEGLKVGGKKTAEGYVVEVLIPWKNLSGLAPRVGRELGLFFRLDEYDARDTESTQSLKMTYKGIESLSGEAASRIARFELAKRVADPAAQALPLLAVPRVPRVIVGGRTVSVGLEADRMLPGIASLRVQAVHARGATVLDQTFKPAATPADWGTAFIADAVWPADAPDGYYAVRLTALDASGRSIGSTVEPMAVVAGTMAGMMDRLAAADLRRLSQTEPFRASAYVAVAADVERLKRSAEAQDVRMAVATARQTTARLNVLSGGSAAAGRGLYSVLAVAADPEGQVVVEFPSPDAASVVFHCGAVPLLGVRVEQRGNPASALQALDREESVLVQHTGSARVGGRPARTSDLSYSFELTSLDALAPDREVVLVCTTPAFADILDLADLSAAVVKAATILPDCPAGTRRVIEVWAQARRLPILPLAEAKAAGRFLVAGRVRPEHVIAPGRPPYVTRVFVARHFCRLEVADGDQVVRVDCPSQSVAELAARWVMDRRAVSSADAAGLRLELVKALAPPAALTAAMPLSADRRLFCGDVHMHSFYSDGYVSPVGLMLQAIYSGHDYAVITDHNTTAGAELATRLFAQYAFVFPITVGEEITTPAWHMNAYPVKRLISWQLPADETAEAAHEQDAAIQWNHPGFPAAAFSAVQMPLGLAGTGFDAWEHYPPRHDQWRQAGRLPVITGSTDTHSGTFEDLERTIILAPSAEGEQVASAVRSGRVVAVLPGGDRLLYGPDDAVNQVWAALAEGTALTDAKAQQIRTILKDADAVGLLRASPPRPVRETSTVKP